MTEPNVQQNGALATKVAAALERFPYLPLGIFLLLPALLVWLIYVVPPPFTVIFTWVSVAIFVSFVLYLYLFKREERASLGGSAPAIAGPFLAQFYAERRAPHLAEVLENGGDSLLQIAFLFASLIGLVVYMFAKLADENASKDSNERVLRLLGYLITLAVLVVIAFWDLVPPGPVSDGPPLVFGSHAPPVTPLTVCRALLGAWSVFLATWPQRRRSQ